MTRGDVLVVGSYNRDVVARLLRWPGPGETQLGCELRFQHGGKGSNQAVQAARCGAQVRLLAAVGLDATGSDAIALWQREGIDTGAVQRIHGERTGTALVLVESNGENRIGVDAGANAALSIGDPEKQLDLPRFAVVAATLEVPAEPIEAAFAHVRKQGGVALLNAAPMNVTLVRQLADLVDILVVNHGEAVQLLGQALPPEHLCAALLNRIFCGRAVVVTAGADGAWLAQRGAEPLHRPALAVDVLDSTGAGDAFIGAMVAWLAEGEALETAFTFATAAGALACTVSGAEPSLALRAEIEAKCRSAGLHPFA